MTFWSKKLTLIDSLSKSETAIITAPLFSCCVSAEVSLRRKLGSLIRCWNFTGDLVGVESESPKGLKIPVGRFFSAGSSTMVASVVDAPRTLNREELRLDNVTSNGRVVSSLELGPELYEISVVLKISVLTR